MPRHRDGPVEGTKGGKVLLTLQFMPWGFMLAFLLDRKCSACVLDDAIPAVPTASSKPMPTVP